MMKFQRQENDPYVKSTQLLLALGCVREKYSLLHQLKCVLICVETM